MEVLFADTFSHSGNEEANVDVVKFSNGALVKEVRIIPINVNVPRSVGVDCFGATRPAGFSLEIFADVIGFDAAVNKKLGQYTYAEGVDSRYVLDAVSVNELIFRGKYTSLTVLVLGHANNSEPDPPRSLAVHPVRTMPQTSILGQPPPLLASPVRVISTVTSGAPIPTIGGPPLMQLSQLSFNPAVPPPPPGVLPQPPIVVARPPPTLPIFDPTRPPPVLSGPLVSPPQSSAIVSPTLVLSPGRGTLATSPARPPKPEWKEEQVTPRSSEPPTAKSPQSDEHESATESSSQSQEGFDLESISDTDFEYVENASAEVEITEEDEHLLSKTTAQFNPAEVVLQTPKYFPMPWLSAYEISSTKECDSDAASRLLETAELMGRDFTSNCDGWLEAVEPLLPNLETAMIACDALSRPELVQVLCDWTLFGCSGAAAVRQPKAPYIIRHMKAGIEFADKLSTVSSNINVRLVSDSRLQHVLLDLMERKFMQLPIKLMIVQALSSSVTFIEGMHSFVTLKNAAEKTAYMRLADSLLQKQNARFEMATKALLRKVALYESLHECSVTATTCLSSVENQNGDASLPTAELVSLVKCLKDILLVYRNSDVLISFDRRTLPVSVAFENRKSSAENMSIYRMFLDNGLVESLVSLCTSGAVGVCSSLASVVRSLLSELYGRQNGLLFLLHQPQQTQHLLATLLKQEQEEEIDERCALHQTGSELAARLQALLLIDSLLGCGAKRNLSDSVEEQMLSALHRLHNLSLSPIGRRCTTVMLSEQSNLQSLLQFMRLTGDPEADARLRKSASAGYAVELLLLTVRYSNSAHMLRTFSDKLLIASAQDVETRSSKLLELRQWVEPLKKCPGFGHSAVSYFAEKVKSYIEEAMNGTKIPKGMVTSLRILKDLTVAPDTDEGVERPKEMKYHDALVILFASDMYSALVQLINRLCSHQLINWQQGLSYVSREGTLFTGAVIPAVTILRALLCDVISARGEQFKDMTAVKPLLSLYALCCSMPPSASAYASETQQVRAQVCRSLLAFTLPELSIDAQSDCKSSALIRKSVWTKMLSEILTFTLEAPNNFVAGITIISELIPLPLPVQTDSPLTDEEEWRERSARCLWSAHLMAVENEITSVLSDLASSTHSTLQQSIRRLCVQLCDLSPQTSTLVGRSLLCSTLSCLPEAQPTQPSAAKVATLVNLLSYLCSQAPAKMTLLALIESDESYDALLKHLLDTFNLISDNHNHLCTQESIVSLLMSLCDEEISLGSGRSVPSQTHLEMICAALLTHIGQQKHAYNTVIPTLRVLLMLCDYDYGLYVIEKALLQDSESLRSLLSRLVSEFNVTSSDCLSTLHATLEFVRSSLTKPNDTQRDTVMCGTTMRSALDWAHDQTDKHPLSEIERLLKQHPEDALTLKSYSDSVHEVIELLSSDNDGDAQLQQPLWEPLVLLENLFAERQVWVQYNADEDQVRLTPHYWFPTCALEEMADESDGEKVPCDLEAMRQEILPQFNPKDELDKKVTSKHAERIKKKARPGIINTSRGEGKKSMPPPLRGRGFVPRGPVMPRFKDNFRSRPQNTSRAPSMHVDDFIVMESQSKIDNSDSKSKSSVRDASANGKREARNSPRPAFPKELPRGSNFRDFSKTDDSSSSGRHSNTSRSGGAQRHKGGDRRSYRHVNPRKPGARSSERRTQKKP